MENWTVNKQPKIRFALTVADKAIEAIGWILLLLLWGFVLTIYSSLPEIIPTHFNTSGIADGFGSKDTIFLLPVVGTFVFILLTVINYFPQSFNYIVAITPENAERQQRNATGLLRSLKCMLLIIFITLVYYTSQATAGSSVSSLAWMLPVLVGSVFLCIGYYLYKSFKMK